MSAMKGFVTLITLAVALYFLMAIVKGGGLKGISQMFKGEVPGSQPLPPTPPASTPSIPSGGGGTKTEQKKSSTSAEGSSKKSGNGNNGNNGNGGNGGDDDEDEDDDDDDKPKSGGGKKGTGPTCSCPSKPSCDSLCNSPETFKYCCPLFAKQSRTVFNGHMMAYVANLR